MGLRTLSSKPAYLMNVRAIIGKRWIAPCAVGHLWIEVAVSVATVLPSVNLKRTRRKESFMQFSL